ncbi:MAG: hypothetical protein JNM32_01895 [Dechloromonas sp.]|jgi:hypothetical protein|nr:hypothetical protein [Dechloromonas sp.]
MVSPEDYAAMRDFYADRLRRTPVQTAGEAAAEGMNDAVLEKLLTDES